MTTTDAMISRKRRAQNAAAVLAIGLLLGPLIGAIVFSLYRAVATQWGATALQGQHLFLGIYFAYVFTIVPALMASAILAWRTWRTGGFGYLAAALTACLCMLGYLGTAAFVFKNERVRVVNGDIALTGVLLAVCTSIICTWLLRWAHLINTNSDDRILSK
jgi:hypothetical protein